MTAAMFSLITAVAAALIARSVMTSNHRQAWINGLREDLASFFTAIDRVRQTEDPTKLDENQRAKNDALLAYRKILMRLNMSERPHQELEKLLETLLTAGSKAVSQSDVVAAVTLARTILKKEWEVTKYGLFAGPIVRLKTWSRPRISAAK